MARRSKPYAMINRLLHGLPKRRGGVDGWTPGVVLKECRTCYYYDISTKVIFSTEKQIYNIQILKHSEHSPKIYNNQKKDIQTQLNKLCVRTIK